MPTMCVRQDWVGSLGLSEAGFWQQLSSSDYRARGFMNLWKLNLHVRRGLVLGLTILTTLAASGFLLGAIVFGNLDPIDWLAGAVFVLIMLAGSFNFWLYVLGYSLTRVDQAPVELAESVISTRTAVVMPLYNEEMGRVYMGVRQTWLSLKASGLDAHCDFYLLCDSTDTAKRREEDACYERLLPWFNGCETSSGRIFLVRRTERAKYKAGNIATFLQNHGGAYDFMVVLDADSVMLGSSVKRLIQSMQLRKKVAVLQTMIIPIRASTPFARIMQFGNAISLPLFGSGLYWFLGRDSVYWGHNAIIRIAPFMEHCNLPIMPGKPPLGGHIMSQDIVEAALLGRAGWAVEWDVDACGSYDEMPANVLTYAQRDRRWCQGNFQHFWLIFGDGIRWGHRFYFANGIMAYASSPLLLLLLVIGSIQGLGGRPYELDAFTLGTFLTFFLGMFLIPRLLASIRRLRQGGTVRNHACSMLFEVVSSMLVSPALLYLHARFVVGILAGRRVQWKHQSRDPNQDIDWRTAASLLWVPTVLGVVWLVMAAQYMSGFLMFLLPILTGWILAIPVAVLSSRSALGEYLSRHHLLEHPLTADERIRLGPLISSEGSETMTEDATRVRSVQTAV